MDFSTEFVALRDKLLNRQDPHFRSQQNVQVSGRMAALLSVFNSRTPRKILGLMPTGGTSHAHEYRLLFAVPSLDEQTLDDWWKYAQQVSAELPDAVINGAGDIPHVVNLSMPGCKSEVMLHVLEGDEVYISSGSACSKGKQSGVLKALGLPKARTDSALRVSFAPFNTKEDVDAFIAAVKKGAKMFRR